MKIYFDNTEKRKQFLLKFREKENIPLSFLEHQFFILEKSKIYSEPFIHIKNINR